MYSGKYNGKHTSLWEFINDLTQSSQACRGVSTTEISPRAMMKNIRQLYCLSVVMFTINPQCNLPFHIHYLKQLSVTGEHWN